MSCMRNGLKGINLKDICKTNINNIIIKIFLMEGHRLAKYSQNYLKTLSVLKFMS